MDRTIKWVLVLTLMMYGSIGGLVLLSLMGKVGVISISIYLNYVIINFYLAFNIFKSLEE